MVRAGLIGTLVAVVAVAIAFFIGDAVSGPLMVTPPGGDAPEELVLAPAVFSTVIGGIVGLGLATLFKRVVGNPVPAFVGFCIVALIAYGAFSFTAAEEFATGVWLNVFHIAAALPIVGALARAMQGASAATSQASGSA